jgi:two-component system, LytTR family, sensor kinase
MSNPGTHSTSRHWLWSSAIWGGFGLFDATQTVFVMRAEGMHHYWYRLFWTLLVAWLPWMLATPLVLRLSERYPATQWRQASTWAVHLASCATLGLAHAGWLAMWESLLNPWAITPGPDHFPRLWLHKFYGGLLSYIILYGLILLVGHALRSREQLARQQTETAHLNEQLSKAQLSALRRQIEPHFLFNTLNAIAGLVREKRTDAAVSMIAGLSDFLRRVVEDSDRQQVPLSEELEFTQKYLDIQKARFADRLQFSVNVPAELLSAQVPSLVLQPMVENAVKHGIAKRVQGGAIRIAATHANGTLTLRVYNDGPGLPAEWEQRTSGIGMLNVRTRLRSLYGDAFMLTLHNQNGGVEASVSVPYISPEPDRSYQQAITDTHSMASS